MDRPTVFISVINWNSTSKTLQCVEMLQQQVYPQKQIVVVDNASQLDALEVLKVNLPRDVLLIESEHNTGYAGGHAQALALAQQKHADFFWFINSDIVLQPHTINLFLEAYQQFGDAIYGTVPLENQPNGQLSDYRVLFHRKFFLQDYREILFAPNPIRKFGELFPTNEPRPVTAVSGSCIFLPMSIIDQYGFMDEDYFMYSEEIDYCFRLRNEGIPAIIVPKAYLVHEKEGTSRKYKRLHSIILYYRLRNQLVRIRRYGSGLDLLCAVVKNFVLSLSYLLHGRSGFEKTMFGFRATIDGVRGRLGKTFPPEEYLD